MPGTGTPEIPLGVFMTHGSCKWFCSNLLQWKKIKQLRGPDISEISFQLPHEVNNLDVLKHLPRVKEGALRMAAEARDDEGNHGLGSAATVGTGDLTDSSTLTKISANDCCVDSRVGWIQCWAQHCKGSGLGQISCSDLSYLPSWRPFCPSCCYGNPLQSGVA